LTSCILPVVIAACSLALALHFVSATNEFTYDLHISGVDDPLEVSPVFRLLADTNERPDLPPQNLGFILDVSGVELLLE
jgi:hypothetical protein